jgi:hypothetical protein
MQTTHKQYLSDRTIVTRKNCGCRQAAKLRTYFLIIYRYGLHAPRVRVVHSDKLLKRRLALGKKREPSAWL